MSSQMAGSAGSRGTMSRRLEAGNPPPREKSDVGKVRKEAERCRIVNGVDQRYGSSHGSLRCQWRCVKGRTERHHLSIQQHLDSSGAPMTKAGQVGGGNSAWSTRKTWSAWESRCYVGPSPQLAYGTLCTPTQCKMLRISRRGTTSLAPGPQTASHPTATFLETLQSGGASPF